MTISQEELDGIRARAADMRPSITPLNERGIQAWLDRATLLTEVDALTYALEQAIASMNEYHQERDQAREMLSRISHKPNPKTTRRTAQPSGT